MDEDNFDKLTLEEQCVHKNWKARLSGYSSLAKLFKNLDSESSNEWNKYVHIIKNIVADMNDPALEKGLEVIPIFLDKCCIAGKTVTQVMPVLVKRGIASPRPQTKTLSTEICIKFTEIGKQDVVLAELLRGTDLKAPKIVSACIHVITQIVKEFGTEIIDVNSVLGKVVPLLEYRDLNVRNTSKALMVELYRWLGPSLKPYLDKLKASKLSEVVADIAKIQDLSPMPTRFLRSEQTHSMNQANAATPQHSDSSSSHSRDEIDPFNTLKPTDVMCRVPSSFYSQIKSPKWAERKDALESLEKILSQTKRIKNGDFSELITILNKLISKDTNVAVVVLAIRCIALFAMGLRTELGSHVTAIFKVLLEKLKERRTNVVCPLREAVDALFKCSSLDRLSTELLDGFKNKNPNVRSETALFLSRCFPLMPPLDLSKKTVTPLMTSLTTCINDQDPTVRNSAASALGVAVRIVGEKKLAPLLENLDHQKLIKIKEYARSTETHVPRQGNTNTGKPEKSIKASHPVPSYRDSSPLRAEPTKVLKRCNDIESHETRTTEKELDRGGFTPTGSRSSKNSKDNLEHLIPEAIINGMAHENWAIRLQAISDLKQKVMDMHQIPANIGDVMKLLSSRILDNNPKIATTSISLVVVLAEKMGQPLKCYIPTLLHSLMKCIGDSKKWVSQPAVECLDSLSKYCGYTEMLKSDILADELISGSQSARVRLWQWFSKSLHVISLKDTPREELEKYLPPLFASLEDRSLEVRNSASMTAGRLTKLMGLDTVSASCESFFKGRSNPITKLLVDKSEDLKLEYMGDKAKPSFSREFITSSEIPETNSPSENEERSPLLDINNLKHQRVIDEHKNKIIKWEFTAPRAEFVDLLKSLMSAANFSQTLMNHMFHDDFKYQLAAMDMLLDELQHHSQAVVSNLDLILRWLTLRFFDTCPIVLAKGLDFLNLTLDLLKKMNYCFLDCEASTLVPYIVLKMADPRDNVQMKVKEILLKLSHLYPVSKLKKFVMDGLRTKSTRQKLNCLDVLKSFIDIYGETVYIKDLYVIAEQIVKLLKDRDSEIKKMAFSVAASLFSHEGEKILKFIEKFAEKDPAIEKRIRKLAAARLAAGKAVFLQNNISFTHEEKNENMQACSPVSTAENLAHINEENVAINYRKHSIVSELGEKSNVFKLDRELLKELECAVNVTVRPLNLVEVDLEFLKEDKLGSSVSEFKSTESCKLLCSSLKSPELSIDSIANDDLISSIKAIREIDELLNSEKYDSSLVYIDSIVHQVAQQLCKLAQVISQDHLRCYGTIFTLLLTLCSTKRYTDRISRSNLCFLLEQLLLLISYSVFDEKDSENYRTVVNKIVLKILVNGRKTDLLCGLLEMMGESRDSTLIAGKIHELYMKCLWKLDRTHPSWDAELDYFEVFKSMKLLIKTYDFPWWTSNVNDSSLRTMKTILRSMVKMRGELIVSDARIISSVEGSGLDIYVRKLLQSMKLKKRRVLEIEELPKQNLLIRHACELSSIFKTVSTNPSEGMEQLNKFRDDHPEVDLHRIVSKVSPAFLPYLNGQRNSFQETVIDTDGETTSDSGDLTSRGDFSEETQRMWDRLKVLQKRIRSS